MKPPPRPESPAKVLLRASEVAPLIGFRPAWVRQNARKLGGRLIGSEWRFPARRIYAMAGRVGP